MEIVPANFNANPGRDSIRATVDSINHTEDGSVVIIGNFDFTIANSQQVKVVLKLDHCMKFKFYRLETWCETFCDQWNNLFSDYQGYSNLERFCVLESAQKMNAGSYSYPFEIESKCI